jgi:hypothetical protein
MTVRGEYPYPLVIGLQSVHSFYDSYRSRALDCLLVIVYVSHCAVVFHIYLHIQQMASDVIDRNQRYVERSKIGSE